MFDAKHAPWVTIPAEDVRIQLPMDIYDGNIKLLFRDPVVVDKVMEQLVELKNYLEVNHIV